VKKETGWQEFVLLRWWFSTKRGMVTPFPLSMLLFFFIFSSYSAWLGYQISGRLLGGVESALGASRASFLLSSSFAGLDSECPAAPSVSCSSAPLLRRPYKGCVYTTRYFPVMVALFLRLSVTSESSVKLVHSLEEPLLSLLACLHLHFVLNGCTTHHRKGALRLVYTLVDGKYR
jgi:hypothetical protein